MNHLQKQFFSLTLSLVLGCLTCFQLAHAQERHALVIANSNYTGEYKLNNPIADGTAIASQLKMMGYKLYGGNVQKELGLASIGKTINDFFTGVPDGAHTLVYYAGHGVSLENQNFLIPILPKGVTLSSTVDVKNRAYSLQALLDEAGYSNPSGVNVMFIDACRDAPVDIKSRSVNMLDGMTRLNSASQPKGTFVGYSTEYGKKALDGPTGRNSPYAQELLHGLKYQAALPIEIFHRNLADRVYKRTSGKQYPIYEPKIRGEFCIVACDALTNQAPAAEYGILNVTTTPKDAEVCFKSGSGWNCDRNISRRPVGETLELKVSAAGYKTTQITTVIDGSIQDVDIALTKNAMSTRSKIGIGVGVAILLGAIASQAGGGDNAPEYSITLNPPQ